MPSTGAMPMDEDGSMQTRTSYITKITSKLKLIQRTNKLPTATEEALFHEAITHVLHAVTPTPTQGEDLMEFDQQFAYWTECLLDMNIEDVTSIKPLLGTKNVYKMVHKIGGSKERNYMFYHHKFKLTLVDLRSSEFAFCPPLEDEERCYVQVLNVIPSSLIETEDETNVYSEELLNLYLGLIRQETLHIERNFAKIKGWILKHLSLADWWKVVADQRDKIYYDEYDDDDEYYDENELALFRKELSDKCEVSNENMIDYIYQVNHCITVAFTIEAFIYQCITLRIAYDAFKIPPSWKKLEWVLIFALNVLIHEEHLQNHHASRKEEHVHHGKGRYKNVIILENIIEDLRRIGDCNSVILDEEEMTLVHKIWGSVASSTHFFVSAIAYEKRRHLVDQYKTFGVSILEFSTMKAGEVVDSTILKWKQHDLEQDIKFARDLKAYRRGLTENKVEKLARDQEVAVVTIARRQKPNKHNS